MIHQYKLNGFNIVLDVFSGSVHLVDDLAYDVISLYKNTEKDKIVNTMLQKYSGVPEITENEIWDVINDVEELEKDGKLFFSRYI